MSTSTRPPGIKSSREEKQEIENRARRKFDQLPNVVKQVFGAYMERDDIGQAGRLLVRKGFTMRESARMIIFVRDLQKD